MIDNGCGHLDSMPHQVPFWRSGRLAGVVLWRFLERAAVCVWC
jgi:hypothetical protein